MQVGEQLKIFSLGAAIRCLTYDARQSKFGFLQGYPLQLYRWEGTSFSQI